MALLSPLTRGLLSLVTFLCLTGRLHGQASAPNGRIRGRVTDRISGAAVRGAEILVVADGRLVTSDSAGLFTLAELPVGQTHLTIRAARYPVTRVALELKSGDDTAIGIELDSTGKGSVAQQLDAMVVNARAEAFNYRLVEFHRRQRAGVGQFLTEEDIRKSGASNLTDATRAMRGVTSHCGGSECHIQMVRALNNCPPEYFVDGQLDNVFGPLTPIRDIIGLEVYTGAADVPGEFAGARAGCGVIAIWTLSGGPRRGLKKP